MTQLLFVLVPFVQTDNVSTWTPSITNGTQLTSSTDTAVTDASETTTNATSHGQETQTQGLIQHADTTITMENSTLANQNTSILQQHTLCECVCRKRAPTSLPDAVSVRRAVGSLRTNLTVDRRSTSVYFRKRKSANDNRTSVVTIGVLGLALLFSFLVFFVAADFMKVAIFLWGLCTRRGLCQDKSAQL